MPRPKKAHKSIRLKVETIDQLNEIAKNNPVNFTDLIQSGAELVIESYRQKTNQNDTIHQTRNN